MTRKFFSYEDRIIPMHFPRLMVEVASKQVANPASLLAETGITEAMFGSPDARISLRQYASLCHNALTLTANPGLGFDLGRRVQLSNLGMLGLAAMSSPDVKTAFGLGLRYYRLLAPFWDISLEVQGEVARVVLREAVSLSVARVFATEVVLVSLMTLTRALVGRDPPGLQIELDYPKPPHAARYAELTDAHVLFGRPVTQITVHSAILEQKLASSDPLTARLAERECAAGLSRLGVTDGLLANVRRMLEASPGRYPAPDDLAHALQTSERTLRRALTDMGTSYQSLLDIARCKNATELLIGTDMTIQEIAAYLGFSEGRALRRAFKRWTGCTAAEYREQKRSEPSRTTGHSLGVSAQKH